MGGVTEIRYVGYGLPDIKAERKFYGEVWGLREVAERDGMVYFASEGHDELYIVRLREAQEKQIDIIALAADSPDDVDYFHYIFIAGSSAYYSEFLDNAFSARF